MLSSSPVCIRFVCLAVLAITTTVSAAVAHEVRPAVVTATFEQAKRFDVTVSTNL